MHWYVLLQGPKQLIHRRMQSVSSSNKECHAAYSIEMVGGQSRGKTASPKGTKSLVVVAYRIIEEECGLYTTDKITHIYSTVTAMLLTFSTRWPRFRVIQQCFVAWGMAAVALSARDFSGIQIYFLNHLPLSQEGVFCGWRWGGILSEVTHDPWPMNPALPCSCWENWLQRYAPMTLKPSRSGCVGACKF